MSTPTQPATPPVAPEPAQARATPVPAGDAHAEDLDPEEDIAPNLGGEDQMQDA
jgi:hypothetical protein